MYFYSIHTKMYFTIHKFLMTNRGTISLKFIMEQSNLLKRKFMKR